MTSCFQLDRTALKCDLFAEVTRTFGESRLKVTGSSMLPSVQPGDVLSIRQKSLAELNPGQIVVFHRNGGLVAHRIVEKIGVHLITRGDSLRFHDRPVVEEEVVGQVISILRDGRPVDPRLGWMQRAAGWIFRHSNLSMRIFLRCTR